MTVTLQAMQPRKCACCWPLVNGCVRNCGPVVIDTGGAAPLLDDTYETCLTTQVAEWATLAFTDIAPGALADGVYASEIRYRPVSGWESCAWQVVAYCVADEAGNRGRKWVIELLFYNNIDGFSSITHEVLDWVCTCDGASFTFEGEGDIPECLTAPDVSVCSDGCPECYTLVASGFGGGSDGANANGTFVLRRNPCSSPNCGGNTSWNVTYGAYNWTLIASSSVPSGSARLWFLQWGSSASSDCRGPNAVWYRGDVFGVIDCNADVSLVGARTGTGLPRMTSWPTSLTLTPGGC